MGHYVYKYVNEMNEVLYVGKTNNMETRTYQHTRDKLKEIHKNCRIYCYNTETDFMSESIETLLINKYKPKYNIAKTKDCKCIYFEEPKFELYKEIEEYTYDYIDLFIDLDIENFIYSFSIDEIYKYFHSFSYDYFVIAEELFFTYECNKEFDNKHSFVFKFDNGSIICKDKKKIYLKDIVELSPSDVRINDYGFFEVERFGNYSIFNIFEDGLKGIRKNGVIRSNSVLPYVYFYNYYKYHKNDFYDKEANAKKINLLKEQLDVFGKCLGFSKEHVEKNWYNSKDESMNEYE